MKLKEQLILSLEAATHPVSVALLDQGKPLGLIWLEVAANNSETLLSSIDQLLELSKKDKGQLQGIAVSLGPGSFTSLRVSLSTAEGLSLGLNVPCYGLGLLEVIAATIAFGPKRVQVAQNAYKGEFYHGLYDCSGAFPQQLGSLKALSPQDLYDSLQPGDLVVGTGLAILEQKGLDLKAKGAKADFSFARQPNALVLAESLREFEAQPPFISVLEPIYLRASEAELNYEKNFRPRKLTD